VLIFFAIEKIENRLDEHVNTTAGNHTGEKMCRVLFRFGMLVTLTKTSDIIQADKANEQKTYSKIQKSRSS